MRIARKCKVCDKEFQAIKVTQLFCSRRCFKRDYYLRVKALIEKEKREIKFPVYRCLHCDITHALTFSPLKEPDRFKDYVCPFCGMPSQAIWEHRYDVRFTIGSEHRTQYIISSAILSYMSNTVTAA